jgi:hypothetical protein
LASIDIRNGRLSRENALGLIERYEGKRPPSLDMFLDFIGISEEEFMRIAISHTVSPWHLDANKITPGERTKDFEQWCRHGKMPSSEAGLPLKRWLLRNGKA